MPPFPGQALIARLRALFRAILHRDDVESEIHAEFRHHLEMRTADLVRRGLSEDEASHQARREFGHIDTHRADARASRGFRPLDQVRFSWLDVKLALRMLVKHPLLSLAAVFALAVGIPVGIAPTHLAKAVEAPLPGDTENRVRAIRLWNPATSAVGVTGYQAFALWKATLTSFSTMAAFRTSSYNVASDDGRAASVPGAELSPAAFSILRAAPRLGRALNETDAERARPAVVVLGHDLWQSRFGSDPLILGRSIRIGREMRTVVGVMPAGFRFPAKEQLWLPLPSQSAGVDELSPVRIIGRLADGISAEEAQAELSARGLPQFANEPESRARLRPEVVPFGLLYMGLPRGGFDAMLEYRFVQLLSLVLLLVACGNVAMLVFARTATRFREMAIRTALGASRARIVSQIFVETLMLAVVAAGVGVLAIGWGLQHVNLAAIAGESALPYWLSLDVTSGDLLRALLFAAVSATVAGVVPAIRITGKAVHQHIREKSGVRFGRLTGALVIADIAVSVAAIGFALSIVDRATVGESDRFAGIPAAEYLAVQFRMPDDGPLNGGTRGHRDLIERTAAAQRALVASLEIEPGISRVAVGSALPRMEHQSASFEVDGVDRSPSAPPQSVRVARVDVGFFEALGHRVVAGRDFTRADLDAAGRRTAIVNTAFVTRELAGKNFIGRRVRFPSRKGTDSAWYEIVGVVGHLGVNMVNADKGAAVYLPASPGSINPMWIGIHANVSPLSIAPRVREIMDKVAPDFVMGEVAVLSDVHQGDWYLVVGVAAGLAVLVGVLVALAASGIYAMLSLSVSERTREIGIRTALGAQRRTVVLMILKRSLVQIGIGAMLGLPLAARVVHLTIGSTAGQSPVMSVLEALGLAASLVLIVGVISCTIPTRRVLAVEASEAMRSDG